MILQDSTRSKIDSLVRAVIAGEGGDVSEGQGPYALIMTPGYPSGGADSSSQGLSLFGETVILFQQARAALVADSAVEHLTHAALRDALASFVLSLDADRGEIRGNRRRSERIDQFVAEIARPLSPYEVAFKIDGVVFNDDDCLTVGEVEFRNFSAVIADGWDLEATSDQSIFTIEKFIDRPVGIVTVRAGTLEKALERAEEVLDRALHVLRTSIGYFRPSLIYDDQLRQARGHLRIIRQLEPETRVWRGWRRRTEVFDTEISGMLLDSTKDFIGQLQPLYDGSIDCSLRDALLRSLEWIGTSITRENYDHKVVDLCTALEAILTTKSDARKGEALALRVMLLSMALGTGFRFPGQLHQLYELRSNVVHGAKLGECGRNDYLTLRSIAEESVLNVIKLSDAQGPFSRPHDVIAHLETRDRLEKAASLLDQFADENTIEVARYSRSRLCPVCSRRG